MAEQIRVTISELKSGVYQHDKHALLADKGMRRYHPFSFDFDSTPLELMPLGEHGDNAAKNAHKERRAKFIKSLETEYGSRNIEQIVENMRDLGTKSISLLSYHNEMHEQARQAFIVGAYYPALVSACALGERILNHLILDLRDSYRNSPHYKKVHSKRSFLDWNFATSVLEDWKVLVDGIAKEFLSLSVLRNRSIHFNPETYNSMREDALSALQRLGNIISKQFGLFGGQPWFIEGTPGVQLIKQSYETTPFVRRYIIPRSGFVGPFYGMECTMHGYWQHLDYDDYGDASLTDEQFARELRERDPARVVTREMIERNLAGKSSSTTGK